MGNLSNSIADANSALHFISCHRIWPASPRSYNGGQFQQPCIPCYGKHHLVGLSGTNQLDISPWSPIVYPFLYFFHKQLLCYDLVLPPFYFLFFLTFLVTWPSITWSVTWPLSPDQMITWPFCHMTTLIVLQPIVYHIWGLYCLWAHCLASHCSPLLLSLSPLSPDPYCSSH